MLVCVCVRARACVSEREKEHERGRGGGEGMSALSSSKSLRVHILLKSSPNGQEGKCPYSRGQLGWPQGQPGPRHRYDDLQQKGLLQSDLKNLMPGMKTPT